jgi:hypothetical protein
MPTSIGGDPMLSMVGKVKSRRMVIAASLLAAGVLANGSWYSRASRASPEPVWSEVPWPFPMDQWGKGKAIICKATECGAHVALYIRAKIGFCNCATGVADDAELDRISDFDLVGRGATPQAPGRPIAVASMSGRSRPFDAQGVLGARVSALSVGFNSGCDAVIATAVVASGRAGDIEPAVLAFLNSRTALRWTEATLGL